MKPDRGSNWTNTSTSPVRSTLNALLLVEAEQLLCVELLPTAATHVRLREEAVKVRVQVALLVQSILMNKDLVGEGMSCKTFFVLAILRKENWVLSTSKVPELLKNVSEVVFGRKAMGQTWPHWKHSGPEWPCWERTWLTWCREYAFVLFSRFSNKARNLDETTIFERPFYFWLVNWLISRGLQKTKTHHCVLVVDRHAAYTAVKHLQEAIWRSRVKLSSCLTSINNDE